MAGTDIFRRLEKIRNLPTLPVIISRLGKEIHKPESDAHGVARIIEDDPSMMARILKVVNSAFYGGVEPITSVQQAVARMGFVAVNNIAMSTSVFSAFGSDSDDGFNREEFWRHCISTGIASEVLYDRAMGNIGGRYSRDLLHLAGLIHDIGKIVFDQFFHEEFAVCLRESIDSRMPLHKAERRHIGADHAEVGAWLASRWSMSDELVETVRWHHQPERANVEHRDLAMLCHTANYICVLEKIGESGDAAPAFNKEVWTGLGLKVSDITSIVDRVKEESAKSEILLSFL